LTLAQRSPEEQLAVIQHGTMLRPEDPRVRAFAEVLDRIETKCSEDRQTLADRLAGANKVMADRGVREPILDTVRGVATATEGLPSEQPCQDVIVAYALVRVGGTPGTRGR